MWLKNSDRHEDRQKNGGEEEIDTVLRIIPPFRSSAARPCIWRSPSSRGLRARHDQTCPAISCSSRAFSGSLLQGPTFGIQLRGRWSWGSRPARVILSQHLTDCVGSPGSFGKRAGDALFQRAADRRKFGVQMGA